VIEPYWRKLPINFTLVGCAYTLSPFFALWSLRYGPVLKGRWRWFSTLNATLDGGWEQRVDGFKDPATLNRFQLWWQRTRWTWRNPCNGWQSEYLGVDDLADGFTVKRDLPLFGKWYIKDWRGWNNVKRGGTKYPYMFQFWIRRK